ncbi:putative aarF domain-containing protein kinase 1 [Liparis tanakae]|uniref:Putative aarF domain-containing protein kinase 1 n=1 Tax=Liparis tanakae TaxID=230148 RepID=A0A4Z2J5N5_9TELE|nr:putative aarF domain-containing protein kinase 1 [Liparis tanakae]
MSMESVAPMAGNLLKVSSLAAAVCASSGFYLYNKQLNLNDLSVIRFGRAAATTVVISLDYLTAFKHVEHDTEEYWALRSKVGEPFVIEPGLAANSLNAHLAALTDTDVWPSNCEASGAILFVP